MDNTEQELDPTMYLRGVQVDVPTMIALIAALIAATPAKSGKALQRALSALLAASVAMQAAVRAHQFAAVTIDPRPADIAIDRAWGAMVARLQAWTQLPEGEHPEQERAALLLAIVAPDGLSALKLPYRAQWTTLKTRLDELHAQKLDGELTALAGKVFVDEVRRRFDDYGRVLGLTAAQDAIELPNLSALLRDAQQRVSAYVVQVLATIDPDDASTTKIARDALRPLADARENANAARRAQPVASDPVVAKPAPQPAPPAQPAARPSTPPPA